VEGDGEAAPREAFTTTTGGASAEEPGRVASVPVSNAASIGAEAPDGARAVEDTGAGGGAGSLPEPGTAYVGAGAAKTESMACTAMACAVTRSEGGAALVVEFVVSFPTAVEPPLSGGAIGPPLSAGAVGSPVVGAVTTAASPGGVGGSGVTTAPEPGGGVGVEPPVPPWLR
jgi:hypothetical protein